MNIKILMLQDFGGNISLKFHVKKLQQEEESERFIAALFLHLLNVENGRSWLMQFLMFISNWDRLVYHIIYHMTIQT